MAITIHYDGFPEPIIANEGDLILDALMLAGAPVSYSCQLGNCGTCKCELVDLEDDSNIMELEYSEYALTPEQRAKGVILACRTQAWGDVHVRPVDEEDLIVHPSRILHCSVTKLEALTHDITGVSLRIDGGGPMTFSAGQYCSVEFAAGLARDYSMANTPITAARDNLLEFQIRTTGAPLAQSAATYVAQQLKVGDAVRVSGPLGTSYLREKHGGPMLCIAGGSGLAPIESIITTALENLFAYHIYLYIGMRTELDVYHLDKFDALAKKYPLFSYEVVLSEGDEGKLGRTPPRRSGFVTAAVAEDFPDIQGMKAYLAGPPVMVEAGTKMLLGKGMEQRDIHADAFYTAQDKAKNLKEAK